MNRLRRFRHNVSVGTIARVLTWVVVGALLATPKSRPWPVEVSVGASSDTTVVVTWYSQEEHRGFSCGPAKLNPYDSFELYFQPAGESSWTAVGRTRDTSMVHDPQHRVGNYSVRGWRGSEVNWERYYYASTVPYHIGPVRLHEASTGDTSAIGFEYYYGGSRLYVMDTTTLWSGPDLYVTDFEVGSFGPLFLASPNVVSGDPGVRVAYHGEWHSTWLSPPLPDEPALSPRWEPLTWTQVCSLPRPPLFFACRKASDNYAFIKVLSAAGTGVELEAWYQRIQGLRLVGSIVTDTVAR